jgi:hypothetical protein
MRSWLSIISLVMGIVVLAMQIGIVIQVRRSYHRSLALIKYWQEAFTLLGDRVDKIEKVEREQNIP